MSGGNVCMCGESKKRIENRNWVIVDYKCNFSAFNGWRKQPSDYSSVRCVECGFSWRTKAGYVSKLRKLKV